MTRPLLHWTGSVLTIQTATLPLLDSLCVNYVIAKPIHYFRTLSAQGPGPVPSRISPPIFHQWKPWVPCVFSVSLSFSAHQLLSLLVDLL